MAEQLTEYKNNNNRNQRQLWYRKHILQFEKESRTYTIQKVDGMEWQVAESEQEVSKNARADKRGVKDLEMRVREAEKGQREAEDRIVEVFNTKTQAKDNRLD